MGRVENAGMRGGLELEPVVARLRRPRETALWCGRSELAGLERAGTAGTVLLQRLIGEALEGARLLRERSVPQPFDLDLFEDGGGQRVLVRRRKLGGRFESLLQLVGHGTNLWEGDPEAKHVTPSNESRLSCGLNARGRKAVERQTKRLASEATQFFPQERPPASSAC